MIHALYIDPRGPYPSLIGPENCWDEKRDARKYAGPWPVVAHPPCGPWGKLSHFCKHQDKSAGPHAVAMVRNWGGVLEHPVGSQLFRSLALPMPGMGPDQFGGFTVEVNQCEWGHPTRKPTWLYIVGAHISALEAPPFPGRQPTHAVCNGRGQRAKGGEVRQRATAFQARETPVAFASYLVRIATASRRAAAPLAGP